MAEPELATALILASALLHAAWNAILKSGDDRAAMIGVLNVAAAALSAPLLVFVPMPTSSDWVWIGVSVAVHLAYQLGLARMMDTADYSLVYPLSRGLGPLVVAFVAVVFLGEALSVPQLGAILVLITGAALAGLAGSSQIHPPPLSAVLWASLVGLLIGTYTLIDGSAVKHMQPLTFILWSNILILPPMMAFLMQRHGRSFTHRMISVWPRATVMTIVAYSGYSLALYAFRLGGLAEIAVLRETSILFAAVIGALWLRERLTARRMAGIGLIAIGAIALKSL